MLLWLLERWTWSCRDAASAKTERAARRTKVERSFMTMPVWKGAYVGMMGVTERKRALL